jgi:hypothetical protein
VKVWPNVVEAAKNVRGKVFEVSVGRGGKMIRVE